MEIHLSVERTDEKRKIHIGTATLGVSEVVECIRETSRDVSTGKESEVGIE